MDMFSLLETEKIKNKKNSKISKIKNVRVLDRKKYQK